MGIARSGYPHVGNGWLITTAVVIIYLFMYLFVCLFVYLFIYFIYLSILPWLQHTVTFLGL